KESGWSPYAVNPSSGAYGIPQSLGHGHPFNLGDARAQIAWGLNYIRGRYGTPAAAWAHEVANNWYARGGFAGIAKAAKGHLVGQALTPYHPSKSVVNSTGLSYQGIEDIIDGWQTMADAGVLSPQAAFTNTVNLLQNAIKHDKILSAMNR